MSIDEMVVRLNMFKKIKPSDLSGTPLFRIMIATKNISGNSITDFIVYDKEAGEYIAIDTFRGIAFYYRTCAVYREVENMAFYPSDIEEYLSKLGINVS